MWVLRRRRRRYRDNEIQRRLYGFFHVIVCDYLRDEFLRTREGKRVRKTVVYTHHCENRHVVCFRFVRHCVDLLVQLEIASRSLAITNLRSSHEVQGTCKVSRDTLPLLDVAVLCYGILVDSGIFHVSVSF